MSLRQKLQTLQKLWDCLKSQNSLLVFMLKSWILSLIFALLLILFSITFRFCFHSLAILNSWKSQTGQTKQKTKFDFWIIINVWWGEMGDFKIKLPLKAKNLTYARCLKITEKVSFNIASEASELLFHFAWTKVY